MHYGRLLTFRMASLLFYAACKTNSLAYRPAHTGGGTPTGLRNAFTSVIRKKKRFHFGLV
jgi:hypothetical protein